MSTLGQEYIRIQQAKQAIKDAIRSKNVEVPDDLPLEAFANKIREIKTAERYALRDEANFNNHQITKIPDVDFSAIANCDRLLSNTAISGEIDIELPMASTIKYCFNNTSVSSVKIRINPSRTNCEHAFNACSSLQRVEFVGGEIRPVSVKNIFYGCVNLVEVVGVIDLINCQETNSGFNEYSIYDCRRIERVYFKNFYTPAQTFWMSGNLTKECIEYMIDNAIDNGPSPKTIMLPGATYRSRVSQECIERATQRGWIISFN